MSHTITAYDGKYYDDEKPIASIDRSAFSETIHALYEALGAQAFDNGCSGSGEAKCFPKDQVTNALTLMRAVPDADQEIAFLRDCESGVCNMITIHFC